MNILLVEPNFPYPTKSKNRANFIHKNFVPIGLLKLGSFYKSKGCKVKLVRGNLTKQQIGNYRPDKILITSIFTYWSKYVWSSVEHYRSLFPKSIIELGGIYVTLHHNTKTFRELAKRFRVNWHVGLHEKAEEFLPDYSLVNGSCDYYATHAMRGCIRRCEFCGTWKIEPKLMFKSPEELINEINAMEKNKVIFFDNNFLSNPNIKQILQELSLVRINEKPVIFESQSGFDGRLLEKNSELANLLKKARFQNIRIAWDNSISDAHSIEKQIEYFKEAGYPAKDISVFMIYNFNVSYEDMLKKLNYCKKWGVQITDCRYRPLDSTSDNYCPRIKNCQTENDYYIHSDSGWTDKTIREFRKKVRQHNIWIRYAKDKGLEYNQKMERWSAIHTLFKFFNLGRPPKIEIIEKNAKWKDRIRTMNRIKEYYKNGHTKNLDFSNMKIMELDKKLDKIDKSL